MDFFLTLTRLFFEQQSQHAFGILQLVGWKAGVWFVSVLRSSAAVW